MQWLQGSCPLHLVRSSWHRSQAWLILRLDGAVTIVDEKFIRNDQAAAFEKTATIAKYMARGVLER